MAACSAGKVMATVIWDQKAAHTVKSLFIDKIRYCIACVSDMWLVGHVQLLDNYFHDKYFSQIFKFQKFELDLPIKMFSVKVNKVYSSSFLMKGKKTQPPPYR